MAGKVSVNIDQSLVDVFFFDPTGDPLREMERRAGNIASAIKREAPRHTGTLAASVRKNPAQFGRLVNTISIEIVVGSDSLTPYLGYVLDGTPPHLIYPKGAHTRTVTKVSKKTGRAYRGQAKVHTHALRFAGVGGVTFASVVHHPGTSADDFINRGLMIGFAQ